MFNPVAAHCKTRMRIKLDVVRLGEHDVTTERDCETSDENKPPNCADYEDYLIEDSILHPDYSVRSKDSFHDILLIKLDREVSFNKFIQPICLPLADSGVPTNFEERSFVVSGWGEILMKPEDHILQF